MTRKQELVNRWDDFLRKIDARFDESLAAAETAVLESLAANDYDYYASARTLTAIRLQLTGSLIEKIDQTWHSQVEPAMAADGMYWMDEMKKGYDLAEALHDKLERFMFITEGKLSHAYYDHCIGLINKDFHCTQCRSKLAIKQNFFRAQYVPCAYCNTVNTFEPETRYVQIGWNVVHNMAALAALEEYDAAQQAEKQGDTPAYRAAYQTYLERYFREKALLVPGLETSLEQEVASGMHKRFSNH